VKRGQVLTGLAALSLVGCNAFQKKTNQVAEIPEEAVSVPEVRDWRKSDIDFWHVRNERVAKWTRFYERSRDPWKLWTRAQEYLPYIQRQMEIAQLPNELCLLPMIESSFDPSARSQNAAGLWQLITSTALDLGMSVNTLNDERLNWKKSTVAATKYFTRLAVQFEGDWALVLASYNMGAGAILNAIKEQGTNDFWSLNLREETSDYVPKFLAMVQLLRRSYPDPRT